MKNLQQVDSGMRTARKLRLFSDSPEQTTRRLMVMRLYLLPNTIFSYTTCPSFETPLKTLQNLQYQETRYVDSLTD